MLCEHGMMKGPVLTSWKAPSLRKSRGPPKKVVDTYEAMQLYYVYLYSDIRQVATTAVPESAKGSLPIECRP